MVAMFTSNKISSTTNRQYQNDLVERVHRPKAGQTFCHHDYGGKGLKA